MDASNFIPHFDPVGAGLIRTIESQLVPTQGEKERSIKAEIYKLNVYGEFDPSIADECGPPNRNVAENR